MKFFAFAIFLTSFLFAERNDPLSMKISDLVSPQSQENFSVTGSFLFWKASGNYGSGFSPGARLGAGYHFGEENNSHVSVNWTHFETDSKQ